MFVEFADAGKERFYLLVVNDDHHCAVHFGPCVGAAVRRAVYVAATLHILPVGEPPDAKFVKHEFYSFCVGLIVCYKDGFHLWFRY